MKKIFFLLLVAALLVPAVLAQGTTQSLARWAIMNRTGPRATTGPEPNTDYFPLKSGERERSSPRPGPPRSAISGSPWRGRSLSPEESRPSHVLGRRDRRPASKLPSAISSAGAGHYTVFQSAVVAVLPDKPQHLVPHALCPRGRSRSPTRVPRRSPISIGTSTGSSFPTLPPETAYFHAQYRQRRAPPGCWYKGPTSTATISAKPAAILAGATSRGRTTTSSWRPPGTATSSE